MGVKDITFNVEQGDVVGIIGKNGAGKSTLLKILSRVTTPTTGIIRAKGRIASLLEVGTGFHEEMTGRENVFMNGTIMGMTKSEVTRKLDEIVAFAGVAMYIDTPVKRYSSGMRVRLGFAVAAFLEPEILVVDEVLAVGDAEFQKKAIGKMQDVAKGEGRTVLFVSHNMAAVRNLCKTGILLKDGCIAERGAVGDVVNSYLSNNNDNAHDVSRVVVGSEHRRGNANPIVSFEEVERLSPYVLANDSEICVSVIITNRGLSRRDLKIIGLINNDILGIRVGMFISGPIPFPAFGERVKVLLKIKHHNLTQGNYSLDFSITDGGITASVATFDAICNTVTFKVSYLHAHQQDAIAIWRHDWGTAYYQDIEVSAMI